MEGVAPAALHLRPRLSFWLALCRETHLLNEDETPRITRFARQWLGMSAEAQACPLIEAWQNAPKNIREMKFRRKLLWKLTWDKPLTKKDLRSISGLGALGLIQKEELTTWGKLLLKEDRPNLTPAAQIPWQIKTDHLIAHLPTSLDLLWQVEGYLRPCAFGKYPLTSCALRL